MTAEPPRVIGVIGAGTMGSGIAQLACQSGAETLLHDPVDAALARGVAGITRGLGRHVSRGRLTQAEATGLPPASRRPAISPPCPGASS